MMKNIHFGIGCLAWLLFLGCGAGASEKRPSGDLTIMVEGVDKVGDTLVSEEPEEELPVEVFEPSDPDTTVDVDRGQTPFAGDLRYRAGWTDKAGQHLLLISGRHLDGKGEFAEGRQEIFAYQYLKAGEAWELEWKINDFVDGFGCDLAIDLPKEFVRFGDPDEDGILENTFVYTLDSRCDASIVPAKLMMHSQGQKLAIRGYAQLELGPSEEVMNQYQKEEGLPPLHYKAFDPAFEQVDARHKAFASELWDAFLE